MKLRTYGESESHLRYGVKGYSFSLQPLYFRPLVLERRLLLMFVLIIIGIRLNKLFFALRSGGHTPGGCTFLNMYEYT